MGERERAFYNPFLLLSSLVLKNFFKLKVIKYCFNGIWGKEKGREERRKGIKANKKKFFKKSFGGREGRKFKEIKLLMLEWSVGFI